MADLSRKRERLKVRRDPYTMRLAKGAYLAFRRGPDDAARTARSLFKTEVKKDDPLAALPLESASSCVGEGDDSCDNSDISVKLYTCKRPWAERICAKP